MEMTVTFPGGMRVDAACRDFVIRTDQPAEAGGEASAPTPFEHFVASLATCAGVYALVFLRRRGIPTDDVRLEVRTRDDPETGLLADVTLRVLLPEGFPSKYRQAVASAVDGCTVKRHLADPPLVRTEVVIAAPAAPAV